MRTSGENFRVFRTRWFRPAGFDQKPDNRGCFIVFRVNYGKDIRRYKDFANNKKVNLTKNNIFRKKKLKILSLNFFFYKKLFHILNINTYASCVWSPCRKIWAAVFTFNPYLLISINEIIYINKSFIDINKYGHSIHLY